MRATWQSQHSPRRMPPGSRASPPRSIGSLVPLASSVPMSVRVAVLLLLALMIGGIFGGQLGRSNSLSASAPEIGAVQYESARAVPEVASGMQARIGRANAMMAKADGAASMNRAADVADLPPDVTRRRLIETANGNIEVDHLRQALDKAQAIAAQAGGMVTSSNEHNLSGEGKYGSADVTIKVPVDKFRSTWTSLLGLATVRLCCLKEL